MIEYKFKRRNRVTDVLQMACLTIYHPFRVTIKGMIYVMVNFTH